MKKLLLMAVTVALVLVVATPALAQTTGSGPTISPDLQEVGNFRPGTDVNGNGVVDTYVDFTFDQQATVASCCSRFQLVPLDGGAPLKALDVVNGEGTTTLTVAFEGTVAPTDIARGTIDKNTVRVTGTGSETNNPPQAAAINNNGNTTDPDLVSVTKDGDQLLFKFDEAINKDNDVIQNTSGLRFYTQNSKTYNSSQVKMKRGTNNVLRAIYDLPQGVTLDDAVGGYVIAGTVVGNNLNPNELDEVTPVGDTGAQVCPAPDGAGGTGAGNGPTEAPDLNSVGNFRRGPFTSQFKPTTCVDFTFDQVAYLNGGNRSSFQLVPLNAGDALSGTTNVKPQSDQAGDNIVTVVFPGDLSPSDFARGYVDTGVVNSNPNNITSANPANVNQSEDISPNTRTKNPDLVRVRGGSGSSLLFQFDEPLTTDDVVQSNSGLRIYFPKTDQSSTIPSAGAIRVKRVNRTTLRAFYGKDLPEGYMLSDAVGAFAQQGTVQAAQGSRGGNAGKNAFDEVLLKNTCTITGTSGDDTLTGTAGRDVICGLGGDDTIRAAGGDDIIRGGTGNDTIAGGSGSDLIYGQDGDDRLYGQEGDDILRGDTGEDRAYGGLGNDKLVGGSGVDRLFGEEGSDRLYGQEAGDILRGGAGVDKIGGGTGNDNIGGGDANDKIYGQEGRDILRGNAGDDLLRGGANRDNIADNRGADRMFGEAGGDYLDSRDADTNDLVDGGDGRDGCRTNARDTVRNCP